MSPVIYKLKKEEKFENEIKKIFFNAGNEQKYYIFFLKSDIKRYKKLK